MKTRNVLAGLCMLGAGWTRASAAQNAGADADALARASAAITAADLARYVGLLAADSMRGRVTPSPELDQTARYVAEEFRRLGLAPSPSSSLSGEAADRDGIWHYPVPGQLPLDYAGSHITLDRTLTSADRPIISETGDEMTETATLSFAQSAYFAPETGPPVVAERLVKSIFSMTRTGSEHVVLVAGRHTATSLPLDSLSGNVVIYLPAHEADAAARQRVLVKLYAASAGVLVVTDADSAAFAAAFGAALARRREQPVHVVEAFMREATGLRAWPWAAVVRVATVERLLGGAGVDVAALRSETTPIVRALPCLKAWLDVEGDTTAPRVMAPFVAAALEGTDSSLRQQYLVFVAHMDAGSVRGGPNGGVDLGADDDASGVAGLFALAKAFGHPGARPRRSLLFVATSGGARGKDAWGSNASVDFMRGYSPGYGAMVGAINLDPIGRLAGDTLRMAGLEEVQATPRPEWVAAQHPELGLIVADGGTTFTPTSDHFPLVRIGVPSWWIHTETHADTLVGAYHSEPSTPIDVGAAERIVRFIFYFSEAIANEDRRPRWTPEALQRLAEITRP